MLVLEENSGSGQRISYCFMLTALSLRAIKFQVNDLGSNSVSNKNSTMLGEIKSKGIFQSPTWDYKYKSNYKYIIIYINQIKTPIKHSSASCISWGSVHCQKGYRSFVQPLYSH